MGGRRSRRVAVGCASAVLLGSLVLAGCGQQDGNQVSVGVSKTPQARLVAAAASATEALQSGTFSISVLDAGSKDPSDFSDTATGSFDRASHRTEIHTTMTTPPGADVTAVDRLGVSDEVIDGSTEYMKMALPFGTPGLPSAKPWVSLTLPSPMRGGSPFGMSGGLLSPDGDPLRELQDVTGGVTDLGPATVDGVATTHYQTTITPEEELRAAQQSMATAPAAERQAFASEATDPSQAPTAHVQVWIDDAGLIRRMVVDLDGLRDSGSSSDGGSTDGTDPSADPSSTPENITMRYDLLTVNQPVDIQVPPPDQVSALPTCGSDSSTPNTDQSGATSCSEATDDGSAISTSYGSGASTSTSMGSAVTH